jgi:hypothetical protein
MTMRRRLTRLEQKLPDHGCLGCRDRRGRIVFVTAQALADGSVVTVAGYPEPCEHCGQVPERIMQEIMPYVAPGRRIGDVM